MILTQTGITVRRILIIAGTLLCALAFFFIFIESQNETGKKGELVIPVGTTDAEAIARLEKGGFLDHPRRFAWIRTARNAPAIAPGGYIIPEKVSTWRLVSILSREPELVWVTIPEGLRKEQTAEIFSEKLSWDDEDVQAFFAAPEEKGFPISEGVYFPDTYLVFRAEGGAKVAERMINRFSDQFTPYQEAFAKEDIKWDTALKIASLIQRESGGTADMPTISAVIWNRLLKGMKLDIDATLQYSLGTEENGWWPRPTREDKATESPYNTYRVKGLPPEPISNPGIHAIDAVLHPANSKCLYYLHDPEGRIHCAVTYDEHQDNILKYLR